MDDKTAKIPSLKDFQKSQQTPKKRAKTHTADKRNVSKSDTHRVDMNRRPAQPPVNRGGEKVKTYRPQKGSKPSVSGATQKIDKNRLRDKDVNGAKRHPEDRFPEEKAYERKFQTNREQSLTQTRVAGRKPSQDRPSVQNPDRRKSPDGNSVQRSSQRMQDNPVRNSGRTTPPARRPNPQKPHSGKSTANIKKRKKPLSPFARKVRRILVYVLIVLAVLIAGLILSLTVLFKTENIVVTVQDKFYNSQEIISASGLHYQDNIFTSDKSGAEKRLMEKFPYIKSVEIKAVIPDTISIDVQISKEAFAVKTDKLTYVANENSKVLKVIATADEVDVPVIEGVKVKDSKAGETLGFESDLVKDSLSEMFTFAKEQGYSKISVVNMEFNKTVTDTETLEIRYVYDDRIVVYLGIPENITYKMQTAQTIITEKLDVNGAVLTGELDVSQCYDTKKSYFNQYSLIPEAVITEPSTDPTATTEAEEDEYYEDVYYEEDYYEEDYPEDEYYEEGVEGEEVYW